MVYDVFRQLILNRFFLTEDFCKTHQISVSKLRRLISRINAFLKPYDCFIKIGKKVSIVGKESQIRLLFFYVFIFCASKNYTY
ncbi:helix-turn-helix domain-containing protein [Enterococcus saccharolyticus]|uniref:helix-turn-helix domain-containing protein n=1 Tax=Enterococcus saccharolyticus TaxID=41997 RepID=UPI0039E0D24C